jgi:Lrp/AsnC family transcriptional regulator, leucine-responsive regulatory protein
MPNIDKVDAQLLTLLQENGRMSQHDLAKSVGLSAPAVSERLRKLEERGVIRGFAAVLDPKKLGQDITAFISVGMGGSRYYPEFRSRVGDLPEVMECHSVTGQGSHLLKIRVANTAALESLLADIQAWPGVQWTTTSLVLSTIKETSAVPVEPYGEGSHSREDREPVAGPSDLLHVPFRHHL